jgi:hypothetical protein
MKTFSEYLTEAKKWPEHVVPGVNKTYFVKGETESRLLTFKDMGSDSSGRVWLGRIRQKNEKWAIAFYSTDLGADARLKSFDTKEAAKAEYDKLKDGIKYNDIFKIFKGGY